MYNEEQAPVVACGGGLHTVVHCSLNAEGLDDLAAVIKPTTSISGEIRQGQESLHLYMDLQEHQTVIAAVPVTLPAGRCELIQLPEPEHASIRKRLAGAFGKLESLT